MHGFLLFRATATSIPAGGALLASLAPVPELALVLQAGAVGTAVGSGVALRAKRRYRDADTWAITTAWATLGILIGIATVCLSALA